MNTFTASNGTVTVTETIVGSFKTLEVETIDNSVKLAGVHVDALREFFRAEEDERLGRWRDPDRPSFVVYPEGSGGIVVLSEGTGIGRRFADRSDIDAFRSSYLSPSGYAYFDAHPEPKPWHDATPGEVWLLYVDGVEECVRVLKSSDGPRFFPIADDQGMTYGLRSAGITSGRRVWPEVAS